MPHLVKSNLDKGSHVTDRIPSKLITAYKLPKQGLINI